MSDYKSLTERMAFCEAWKQSGLTKIKFCKENNLSKRTFHKWIKQFQSNNTKVVDVASSKADIKTDPIKFLKVSHAMPARNFTLESGLLEISLTNGIALKLVVSQDNINHLLQELLKWK